MAAISNPHRLRPCDGPSTAPQLPDALSFGTHHRGSFPFYRYTNWISGWVRAYDTAAELGKKNDFGGISQRSSG